MKYEVVEALGEWIVRLQGVELARFGGQGEALSDVGERLRDASGFEGAVSLSMRYEQRIQAASDPHFEIGEI